ncbi:MAG: hypothetical protein JKY49_17175 [Cohaesibacteraceae bacterium]|nr:hypothetical protein [Cohaesibacteraceae bacterium]
MKTIKITNAAQPLGHYASCHVKCFGNSRGCRWRSHPDRPDNIASHGHGQLGHVNRIYSDCLGDHRPARGVLQSGALHRGFGIAIDAIAAAGAGDDE